jgi:hypothetical protein
MVALEYYISTNLAVDIWLFPIVTFVGHSYCFIKFHIYFDDVPSILIPGMYVPVIVQIFTSYTLNLHAKRDFLLVHSQNKTIQRFNKFFESIPERIVITQDNEDNGVDFLFTNDEKLQIMEKAEISEFQENVRIL